jgi:hypothetical protein
VPKSATATVGTDYEYGWFHKLTVDSQKLAPGAGLEPATRRLTAGCSTIELPWILKLRNLHICELRPQFTADLLYLRNFARLFDAAAEIL